MDHFVRFSRRPLGRGAIAGSGMRYGTDASCPCGWEHFTNENPPSRSMTWQRNVERKHLEAMADPQQEIAWLRERVEALSAELMRRVALNDTWSMNFHLRKVTKAMEALTTTIDEHKADEIAARQG